MYGINKTRLVNTFLDLVKIPSPSWHEEDVVNYIMKRMKALNVSCKKYACLDSYNLLVTLNGDKNYKPVLFSSHTDTVMPCRDVNPIVTADRILTDGSTILGGDDKAAVAMFIEAIQHIKEKKTSHGTIEFLFSCAEETGLLGAKNFDLSLLKSKRAFVFDSGGSVGRIIIKAPYHMTMEIIIKGRAAHAGIEPEKGINAIKAMAEIISGIQSGRIDGETTVNIGTVSGGRATNIVPDEAVFKLEIRAMDRKRLKDLAQTIRGIIKKNSVKSGTGYKIKSNMEYSGFSINRNDEIAMISSEALKRIKIKPGYHSSGGGSDTNIFNKGGIKAINLSCGMQKVHTTREYILLRDLVDGTRLVLSLIDVVNK